MATRAERRARLKARIRELQPHIKEALKLERERQAKLESQWNAFLTLPQSGEVVKGAKVREGMVQGRTFIAKPLPEYKRKLVRSEVTGKLIERRKTVV